MHAKAHRFVVVNVIILKLKINKLNNGNWINYLYTSSQDLNSLEVNLKICRVLVCVYMCKAKQNRMDMPEFLHLLLFHSFTSASHGTFRSYMQTRRLFLCKLDCLSSSSSSSLHFFSFICFFVTKPVSYFCK